MSARLGLLLVFALGGCRSDVDQQIDTLSKTGITVKRNSVGEVFWVDTAGASLDEHFWQTLSKFEHLNQLALTGSPVTDGNLPQLSSLPALQSLDLSYTRVTSEGLSVLSRMEDLQTLSLNGVSLNEAAIEPLCQLTRLRSLSLMDCGLSPAVLEKVQNQLTQCLVIH